LVFKANDGTADSADTYTITLTATSSGGSTGITIASESLPKLEGSDLEGWKAIEKKLEESINEHATDAGADTEEDAQNGSDVVINLNGITIIPKELFETIRGKNIKVVLVQSDGIEWIINGQDIGSGNNGEELPLKDIDLKVTLGEVNLPQDLAASLTGTDITPVTMSIAHEGSFGFTATLRLNLNKVNQGLIANLYYINPVTNKLELQAADKIGADGNVDLDFVHASDYVIVMDKGETLAKLAEQSTVTPAKETLYIGGTKNKSVTLGTELPKQLISAIEDGTCSYSITYTSSNTEVASVSSSGKIKANKVGKATITTTMDINGTKVSFSTAVTVKKAYIKIIKFTKTMKVGTSDTFQVKGFGVETSDVIWSTTEKSIVAIDKTTGKVTAKTAGTTYIVATVGKIKEKIKVIIK